MTKEQPLYLRLYRQPQYYELARIVGYAGLSVSEAQVQSEPLLKQYGATEMNRVSQELLDIDQSATPPTARLKAAVRQLCWQLLGPPLEQRADFERGAQAPPPLSNGEPAAPPKRRRKKGEKS
jgi:hypothetical protein